VDLEVAGLEFLVQFVLEQLAVLVGRATRRPLVHEVERSVEGDAEANHPSLHHGVEIAGERLGHDRAQAFRNCRFDRWQGWLACSGGR
jgi:hypothetical protein